MNRTRLAIALLVLLAVVGVALAATGLDADAVGSGDDNFGDAMDAEGESTADAEVDHTYILVVRAVAGLLVALMVIGLLAGLVYSAIDTRTLLLAGLVVLLFASVLLWAPEAETNPFQNDSSPPGEEATSRGIPENVTEANETEGGGAGFRTPTNLLVLFGGLVLLGVFLVAGFSRGAPEPEPEDEPERSTRADVGRAAGRAADDLEERDLSNVIYRAWHDMTAALDVDERGSTTPAEFADSAIAAGIDESDVETLTDLFREVRYGDEPVTDAREERARETLQHIEETYAGDGAADESDSLRSADDGGGTER